MVRWFQYSNFVQLMLTKVEYFMIVVQIYNFYLTNTNIWRIFSAVTCKKVPNVTFWKVFDTTLLYYNKRNPSNETTNKNKETPHK